MNIMLEKIESGINPRETADRGTEMRKEKNRAAAMLTTIVTADVMTSNTKVITSLASETILETNTPVSSASSSLHLKYNAFF